jgi:hypothetical protein
MTFDLYAWKSPRDLSADRAEALVTAWQASGGDPSASPFEPSTDVGWFYHELVEEVPGLEASSDAAPTARAAPIWLATSDETPARVVGVRLSPTTAASALDSIFGLAVKYDLVLYDAQNRRLHLPLEEMAALASATFRPAGAIRAAGAGLIGGAIAVAAWLAAIPVLSGFLVGMGGFVLAMAVYTFIHEARTSAKPR